MIALRFAAAALLAALFSIVTGAAALAQAYSPGVACPNGQAITAHTLQNGIVCATVGPPAPNLLLNPSMEIDQANEGANVALTSGAPAYVVDGWSAGFHSGSATVSAQRDTDAPAGFANSLKLAVGTGAAVATGDYLFIRQPIEATQLTNLALGTSSAASVCLSFQVKSSIGSYIFSAVLQNFAGARSYPVNFTVSSANTWTSESICFAADTGGTWVTSGTTGGAYLIITAAVGSTFQGAVNSWGAANYYGTASDTNTILSTSGATFRVTGVKLERSPVTTPFVRRPFADELALCQRQLEKNYAPGTALGSVGSAGASLLYLAITGITGGRSVDFKVTKIGSPTITMYSPHTGTSGKIYDAVNNTDVAANPVAGANASGFGWYGNAAASSSTLLLEVYWAADARLAP